MKIAMVLEADLFSLNFGLPSSVDLGRRRCRTACKYAVKVDVDVATLQPFGQILYRSVHWLSKIGLSAGVGAELRVNMRSTWMSTSVWRNSIPLRALADENCSLGRSRCRTACKYAVNTEVDVATLRPFG